MLDFLKRNWHASFYGLAAVAGYVAGEYTIKYAEGRHRAKENVARALQLGKQSRYEPVFGEEHFMRQAEASLRVNRPIVVVPDDAVSGHYASALSTLSMLREHEAWQVLNVQCTGDDDCHGMSEEDGVPGCRDREVCGALPQLPLFDIGAQLAAAEAAGARRPLLDIVVYHPGSCSRDYIERSVAAYAAGFEDKVRLSFVFAKPGGDEAAEIPAVCSVVRHSSLAVTARERQAWDKWLRWYVQCRVPYLDADAAIEVLNHYAVGDTAAVKTVLAAYETGTSVASACRTRRLVLDRLSSMVHERFLERAVSVYGKVGDLERAIDILKRRFAAADSDALTGWWSLGEAAVLLPIGAVDTQLRVTAPMWRLLIDRRHPNRLRC